MLNKIFSGGKAPGILTRVRGNVFPALSSCIVGLRKASFIAILQGMCILRGKSLAHRVKRSWGVLWYFLSRKSRKPDGSPSFHTRTTKLKSYCKEGDWGWSLSTEKVVQTPDPCFITSQQKPWVSPSCQRVDVYTHFPSTVFVTLRQVSSL